VKALLLILGLTWACLSFAQGAQGTKEILLDNDKVQMVRLTYPPGSESGMHTHQYPHRTVYFVKGGKLELVPEDGSKPSKVLNAADGDYLYLPAMTHNVKNIGDSDVILIEHEIK